MLPSDMDTPTTSLGSAVAASPWRDGFDASRLAHDLNCLYCGYNLRGLRQDGVCTECGQPIGNSRSGARLVGADPRWLDTLCGGAGLLTLLAPWLWLSPAWPLVLVAGWWLSAPNPADRRHGSWVAFWWRLALVGTLVIAPAVGYSAILTVGSMAGTPGPLVITSLLPLPLILIWIGTLLYRLSRQVGERRLRRDVRLMCLCGSVGLVLLALAASIFRLQLPGNADDVATALAVCGLGLLLVGLVTLPIASVRLWRALDRTAILACDRRRRLGWCSPATGEPPAAATQPGVSDAALPARP